MRIRSRSLIASLTLLVGALSCAARAQSPAPWTADSITSRALGVVRFRVSLPPNYAAEAARNDHYPIAIVAGADDNDAQAALVANLRLLGGPLSPAVPSLIIVGIPRFSDGGTTLVPHGATSARFFNRRSVADEAADFVATELVPWLREHFRTTPYTVIAGHSDPGWFASYVYFDVENGNPNIGGMLPADIDGIEPPPIGAPGLFAYFTADEFADPADGVRIFEFVPNFATPAL